MFKRVFYSMMLVVFLFSLLAVTPIVPAEAASSIEAVSPDGFINPDGTLNLNDNFNGSFDLSGWDVQMDPQRGPIFARQGVTPMTPSVGNWEALGGGIPSKINYSINAVVSDGTNVYVGGYFFDMFGNDAMDYVAKWNGSSWVSLGSKPSGDGSVSNVVHCLALDAGGNLYVGGSFSVYNTSGVYVGSYVARWNGTDWYGLGSNGSGGPSLNSGVTSIATVGTDVYVGGYFTDVNNNGLVLTAADYIAKWDGSNWSALGTNGSGQGSLGVNGYVYELAVIGSNVFVGGNFSNISNNGSVLNAADYVAKWDGSNWSALGSNGSGNGSLNGIVTALTANGANLFVGGSFTNINNNGSVLSNADYIAKWDGTDWSALGSGSGGNGSLNGQVHVIMVDGSGNVFAGGSFDNIYNGAVPVNGAGRIAKFDGSNWSGFGDDGAGGPSITSDVYAIAMAGSDLFAGGNFTSVNNGGTILNSPYLARWDGSDWNPVNGATDGSSNRTISAVLANGTDVYVGGNFVNLNNDPAIDYIARWDGSSWNSLGDNGSGDGVITGEIYALAMDGSGNLYAGGSFYGVVQNGSYDGTVANIAKWDGSSWSGLGNNGGGGPSLNSYVYSIAIDGNLVYVAGYFNDVNNFGTVLDNADAVAVWDGSNWSGLGDDGSGGGALTATYAYSYVYSLALDSADNLYAGGYFYDISNSGVTLPNADFIAKWDGSNWSALGSNGAADGALNSTVYSLAVDASDNLYAGGAFYNVNNGGTYIYEADYLAKWDGTDWSALSSNGSGEGSFNSSIQTIVIDPIGNLYVGGYFTDVNNNGSVVNEADYVAKFDGLNWSALGSNGSGNGSISKPSGNAFVYSLSVSPDALYVAGNFFNVNNNGSVLNYADYVAAFGIDYTDPSVVSITRDDPNPTALASVHYTVSFSESVTGVDISDFSIATSGLSAAAITGVSGTGDTYTVTVDTGLGNGSLRLDLLDDDSIRDVVSRELGGHGIGNGGMNGDTYTITKTAPAQITPANGAFLNNRRPFFDWSDYAGAKGYQIQVSKSAGFGTTLLNVSLTGATNSQYTATKDLPASTLLYWRVRGKLSATKYTSW